MRNYLKLTVRRTDKM